MKLRIERRHQYGNSNSEFRSKTTGVPPNTINKFSTINAIKQAHHNKKSVQGTDIDFKDSQNALFITQNKNQAKLRGIPLQTNNKVNGNTFDKSLKANKTKLFSRNLQHQNSQIEAGPLYWDGKNSKTTETEFNLNKIINFKKTLYYRYNKRKNHGKAFFAWDKTRKGYIDENDIVAISEKFGMPMNEKEAKLLIACADIDKNGRLNPREFMNLLFDQKVIETIESDEATAEMNEEKLKTYLSHKLEEVQVNETKGKLFNKIQEHKTYLQKVINADAFNKKDYSISKDQFTDILSKLSNRDKILNQDEINFLYENFKDKTESVNLYDFFYKIKEHENTEYSKLISEAYI